MQEKRKIGISKIITLMLLTSIITFLVTYISLQGNRENQLGVSLNMDKTENEIGREIRKYKKIIDKYYLGEVKEEKLNEGAIRGYIEGLEDPYSEYISKEDMETYMEDTKGNFVGIGIYMVKDKETDRVMVLSPIKGSPAEKAGILPGDFIVSVNDEKVTGNDFSNVSDRIKGKIGTTVKLGILREKNLKSFEIKREKITINPVESKVLKDNIGYIQFTSFDEETSKNFKNEFENLQKRGIKSLIIDLRNNGGGIVSEALKIADYIVDKDSALLYEVDKNNNEKTEKSKSDPIINMPIIVLTNNNTASSAEILAGALKDNNKAKIVGTKTFGKGVIQQIMTMPDGSGIKITCEEYLTPNKSKINKIGIEPDEKIELEEKDRNKMVVDGKDDLQLKKAIDILEKK